MILQISQKNLSLWFSALFIYHYYTLLITFYICYAINEFINTVYASFVVLKPFFVNHFPFLLLQTKSIYIVSFSYTNHFITLIICDLHIKIKYTYMIHSIHSLFYHQFYCSLFLIFLNILFHRTHCFYLMFLIFIFCPFNHFIMTNCTRTNK